MTRDMTKEAPSIDKWLKEAKSEPEALNEGMYLVHNGVVRETPKAKVRHGIDDGSKVKGMYFSYDAKKVDEAIEETFKKDGIFHVRVMYVLIGGDIRPNVVSALEFLVGKIKNECVVEKELKRRKKIEGF